MVPLDGSSLAEQILKPALVLGALTTAEYTLVQVVGPVVPGAIPPAYAARLDFVLIKELCREAEQYLERIAERLRRTGLQVRTRIILVDHAAIGLLDAA